MGALNMYIRDLYPNMGAQDTRTLVQPEAKDRVAMTDEQPSAQKAQVNKGVSSKKIFTAILLIAGIGFVLGLK